MFFIAIAVMSVLLTMLASLERKGHRKVLKVIIQMS